MTPSIPTLGGSGMALVVTSTKNDSLLELLFVSKEYREKFVIPCDMFLSACVQLVDMLYLSSFVVCCSLYIHMVGRPCGRASLMIYDSYWHYY